MSKGSAKQALVTPFSLRKDVHTRGTDFVVSDIQPEKREELDGLDWLIPGVQPRGEEFTFTYPLSTPYVDAGFEEIYVANMGPHYRDMILAYGREVLPTLRQGALSGTA